VDCARTRNRAKDDRRFIARDAGSHPKTDRADLIPCLNDGGYRNNGGRPSPKVERRSRSEQQQELQRFQSR
jgi:hypothetical protein